MTPDMEFPRAYNHGTQMEFHMLVYFVALQTIDSLFKATGQESESEHFSNGDTAAHSLFFNNGETFVVVH